MRKIPLTALALAALVPAYTAVAQTTSPGFFPPTPDGDVALTKIAPPRPSPPEVVAVQVERTDQEREAALRAAEEELDRAEREAAAERARAQAVPAPVAPGAFNGITAERGR